MAGRDYVLIASDTRLTDGGYGINSRRYLSGRLWSASSTSNVINADSNKEDLKVMSSTAAESNVVHWDSDGSLLLPSSIPNNNNNVILSTNSELQRPIESSSAAFNPSMITNTPIIIGSAGCASDCESLKRRMRLELDALQHMHTSAHKVSVSSVANLLQQILYSKRGFPYYSFCVVAGLHPTQCGVEEEEEEGAVYVYDAIGSYERVAVGSSGTGRELLQPILDQLFSENGHDAMVGVDGEDLSVMNHSNNGKTGDVMAIPPMRQRVGVAGSLRPPVQTTVQCTVEDAVRNVARAYQSVAEREISVGDEVVICVVKSAAGSGKRTDGAFMKVFRYPLKKH